MENGLASITFNKVDLDNCIKQGLELTGYAKCPNCKQLYSYKIHLKTKKKLHKYIDTEIDGKTVTTLAPDQYDISIEFTGIHELPKELSFLVEPEEPDVKGPCNPCSRCTPNCERLRRK
ncbi:MAG: hypothetical protein JW943_11020 [Deltaproteobacteria bacterium]|nr:hypothetical protein [Deltaproteobacteria bacterium]